MEWPIKTNFGWPFLKLHGHKAEVLYPGEQSTILLGGLGACPPLPPPRKLLQNKHAEIESETTFNCLSLNLTHPFYSY